MAVEIVRMPADRAPASDLLREFMVELAEMYGPIDLSRTPSAKPEEMLPPRGDFLVLLEDGQAVGCGGVKTLSAGVAEIKRMFIAKEARSRGHARRLLEALEQAARDLGLTRVRLDTGRSQPHAVALYEKTGYRAISDYNGNLYAAYWFEKNL